MNRLAPIHLADLGPQVAVPTYDRTGSVGVVHLGTGAFHRAHQATYFDALMKAGEAGWMIQGASLRSASVADQMNPQGGLFSVLVRDGQRQRTEIVGSVRSVLIGPENPAALISAMAHPGVSLVTLTVTEKGYRPALSTGGLDMDDPDTRHDCLHPATPRSAIGFIVAALAHRWQNNLGPLTLLSCDNMPDNGRALKRGVLALANVQHKGLADWIESQCAFPSSMVDRIVPATTPEDLTAFESEHGLRDEALVKTEPFSQWVVEDHFVGRRPSLERVGVQMTSSVAHWEQAKLRLLNGAHSALAYLGYLSGHAYVHDAIRAPGFREYIDRLWNEAEITLAQMPGFDAGDYRSDLAKRFANTALQHRTFQIAMDGSQKLPQRLLGSIRDRRTAGLASPALELAVAGWMRWQSGRDETGATFRVDDPLASETRAVMDAAAGDPLQIVRGMTRLRAVFGDDFANDDSFANRVAGHLDSLFKRGAAATVLDYNPVSLMS